MVLAIMLFPAIPLAAQDSLPTPPLLINVAGRPVVSSLNGSWRTIIDPFETGYYTYRWTPDRNGYFRNQKATSPGDRVEYDFDRSPFLLVPGDWNTQRPELLLYEGTIWYSRSLDYRLPPGSRLLETFGDAN